MFRSKATIPNQLLFDLLEKVCVKYDTHYVFNYTSFRKVVFLNLFDDFAEAILPAYISSKQYYVTTRPVTYNLVVTIFRQICSLNDLKYEVKREFYHSESNNDYYIYKEKHSDPMRNEI